MVASPEEPRRRPEEREARARLEGHEAPRRVIVLAGPSGAGKSRLAERLALPVLHLDDFYKDGDDPTLPVMELGGAQVIDWDDPASWSRDDALATLERLCREGTAEVPDYDLASSRRVGSRRLDLAGSPLLVAEGIFAPQVVGPCREAGILADALCVRQHRLTTFWRRLRRDLAERRKPPWVLVRRGLMLLRLQPFIVADAVAHGCSAVTAEEARARLRPLLPGVPARP